MEPCLARIIECLSRSRSSGSGDDPCGAYTTGGRICGLHKCDRPIRTIYVHGLSGKTSQLQMHKPLLNTIRDLKLCIKARMGISPEHQRLIFGNQHLDKAQSGLLKDFGIEENSTVILVARLPGGSQLGASPSSSRKRYTGQEASIVFTNSPDCITGDSRRGVARGLMSCGHAVDPGSLAQYAERQVQSGKHVLQCPAIVTENPLQLCRAEWSYTELRKLKVLKIFGQTSRPLREHRRMALLTPGERRFFEERLGENAAAALLDAKACPQCASLVERSDRQSLRVVCPICTLRSLPRPRPGFMGFSCSGVAQTAAQFAFCWKCHKPWGGSAGGGKQCGNLECNWEVVQILEESPSKDVNNQRGVPSTRACPMCGLLIDHTSGCGKMQCQGCSHAFCFVCLRPKCNAQSCVVAARQTEIPPCKV